MTEIYEVETEPKYIHVEWGIEERHRPKCAHPSGETIEGAVRLTTMIFADKVIGVQAQGANGEAWTPMRRVSWRRENDYWLVSIWADMPYETAWKVQALITTL
jgi:hypothetical protein